MMAPIMNTGARRVVSRYTIKTAYTLRYQRCTVHYVGERMEDGWEAYK